MPAKYFIKEINLYPKQNIIKVHKMEPNKYPIKNEGLEERLSNILYPPLLCATLLDIRIRETTTNQKYQRLRTHPTRD